ncbi:MAG TPA: hypothetical protein PKZ53_26875 [Acidobacteriota bacterium]|nr:hypothetical protein [Acidobacteriota bacterium]
MPDEFVIKHETLPVRCEVCHQADFFEPEANHCARCGHISREFSTERQALSSTKRGLIWLLSIFGVALFGIFYYVDHLPRSKNPCGGDQLIILPLLMIWGFLLFFALLVYFSSSPNNSK